ncbi:MAG: hypothetical protein LBU53_06910 [Zoogloeaceae bacterium]|jgi:hypothetical protein|nr:hypothetical protein [Zoogloeaceae bacterium]
MWLLLLLIALVSPSIWAAVASARWVKRKESEGHNIWTKALLAWLAEIAIVFSISTLFVFLFTLFLPSPEFFFCLRLALFGAAIWTTAFIPVSGFILLMMVISLKGCPMWFVRTCSFIFSICVFAVLAELHLAVSRHGGW